MSRDGSIELDFGLERCTFRLGWGEWKKIQEATDAGPFEIYGRLASAVRAMATDISSLEGILLAANCRLRADDKRAVLYHGLIGGGMAPNLAGGKVRELVDGRPQTEQLDTAFRVAAAGLCGVEDEPPPGEGEGEGAAPDLDPSQTEKSASPPSTATRPRSASRRRKSTP